MFKNCNNYIFERFSTSYIRKIYKKVYIQTEETSLPPESKVPSEPPAATASGDDDADTVPLISPPHIKAATIVDNAGEETIVTKKISMLTEKEVSVIYCVR